MLLSSASNNVIDPQRHDPEFFNSFAPTSLGQILTREKSKNNITSPDILFKRERARARPGQRVALVDCNDTPSISVSA